MDEDHVIETLNEYPMHIMLNDAFGLSGLCANEESFPTSLEHSGEGEGGIPAMHHGVTKELFDLLKNGDQSLYDECTEYSKLSFLVILYHVKVLCELVKKQ